MKTISTLILLSLTFLSCDVDAPEEIVDFNKLKQTFMEENINWSSAAKNKDATYIWSLYKEDAWLGVPGKEYLIGKKAIRKNWENTVKLVDDLGFETLSLRGSKDIVYETGFAFTSYTMNGVAITDTSKYLIVWELDDEGNYKIGADLFN